PIISKASEVFIDNEEVEINILNHAKGELSIQGDKDQLLRIFNNLLKNAIEASRDNLKSLIKITITNDKQQVYIEVEDNGKGIDELLRTKIFVPNFTTKSSGTGLGLAFVKQAVENAGGSISFKSFLNVGTTFYLTFPLS
ncbi:MAG TPA: ATP-binding protein, partial [Pedobacter sp.]